MERETGVGIVISMMIVAAVIGFLLASTINIIGNAPLKKEPAVIKHSLENKNVVLRVDDIQAHAWSEIQKRMIQDTLNRGMTLSLGVIPNHLAKDQTIYHLLKNNRHKLEIVLHGYNNNYEEFVDISYEEANYKLDRGLKVLNGIEPNIVTFIPPNNELGEEAEGAVWDRFRVVSAGWWNSYYGYTQTSYDWDKLRLVPHDEIIKGCEKDFIRGRPCIIMIHPQDYATNNKLDPMKYNEFKGLLDGLKENNINVINFRDLL